MRIRPYILAVFALLLAGTSSSLFGQSLLQLQGRVIDAHSMAPVRNARVKAGDLAAVTDGSGRFSLSLAPGEWVIEVSAPGYLTATERVTLDPATATIEILLVDQAQFKEVVTVTGAGSDALAAPPTLMVSPLEVRSVAGAAENVFRALQTLPGVVATDDFGSRISVRGGGPDQNLTVMDGVEIYNPYRLFGLTSAFNPETVENFELTAGGFGAQYGDRLSSLLVVENRAGAADRAATGSFALGLTDSNVIVEGRLPRVNGSWLVTGRRTYYDLVAERFIDEDLPSFADFQAKGVWVPADGRRLTVFGLRSRESADAEFTGETSGERVGFDSIVRNDVSSISFATPLGPRLASRTIASWYINTDTLGVDANVRNESRRSNAPDAEYPLIDFAFTRGITVRDIAARQELVARVSPAHSLESGFDVHRLRTSVQWTIAGERNLGEANGSSARGGAGLPDALDSAVTSTRAAAWLQDRWTARRFTLEPGVRFDWIGVTGESIVSPRIGVVFPVAEVRLRGAGGLYTQSPGYEKLIQGDYFVDLTNRRSLDLVSERAVHAIGGVERDLTAGTLLRVEGFYKRFTDMIVGRLESAEETAARVANYDFPATLASDVPRSPRITSIPTNDGRGRAYGFDVYLARRATTASTRLTGWGSYTFTHADVTAYGREYPFDYDRRHALSLVGTYRVRRSLDVAATLRIASGFPSTPAVGVRVAGASDVQDRDGDGNREEIVPQIDAAGGLVYEADLGGVEQLNRARLPLFARLDGRITWRKTRWQIYLEVINLLDRDNAGDLTPRLEPDPQSERPRITYLREGGIPRIPSVGLRFRF